MKQEKEVKKAFKPTMEFKKVGGDKYSFVMTFENMTRTEVFDKEYLKQHYAELQQQKNGIQQNIGQINRTLEQTKIEKDDELEHFIQLADQAASYNQHLKAESQLKGAVDMLERMNESIKKIETVCPEIKRMKK